MSNLTPEDMKEIARIVREEVRRVMHPSVLAEPVVEAGPEAIIPLSGWPRSSEQGGQLDA